MTSTTTTGQPPRWDMTAVFASPSDPACEHELTDLAADVGRLVALFDAQNVRARTDESVGAPAQVPASEFEQVTGELNRVRERAANLSAYLSAFVSTDSRDDVAQAKQSELQTELVALSRLGVRYQAWLGSIDVDALVDASEMARSHEFAIRRAALAAKRQMPEGEEDLAATLNPAGGSAWTRLHGNVTSRIVVEVPLPSGAERLPMSAVRALAYDVSGDVRRAAYEAELASWPEWGVPLAAALNGVKGWSNVLNSRRRWPDSIEPALFANNVDRATLEAMQSACVASFPDFRRYLRAKAALLSSGDALPWWDLFAPVGESARTFAWDDATSLVVEQFGTYSDRLASLAERAFREAWVDAEPREGKRDGAFCMRLRGDESRVMLNFKPSFGSVSTLAHELGHAYHNLNLAERTPLQRETPMALAETASTFCQTIVVNAMLASAPPAEKIAILENDLQNACQIVVDIHSRFLFEKGVFERREKRELSVNELNELMTDAQRQTYGDGLDEATLHPYMWAVKPHYYSWSYYNWPYTFGLLFGLGLYAHYRSDPDAFRAGYDDLLASTGLGDAAALASRFGIDVRSEAFWTASLDQVREEIDEFETLAGSER